MNIRKGFFRITLVLSILCGILTLYFSEHFTPGLRSKDIKITVSLPSDWGNKTLQDKLNSIDELLIPGKKNEKREKPWTVEELIDKVRGELAYSRLTSREQQNVKRRLREQIISDENKLPEDKEKRNYYVSSGPDWKEITFLLFITFIIGFASVWLIYAFTRWIIIAFIVGGFKGKLQKGGDPD